MAETLRASAFLAPNENFDISKWWENTIGEPPEVDNSRPRDGVRQLESQRGNGRLLLASNPGRVDLLLKAADSDDADAPRIPTIGRFEDSADDLRNLAYKLISILPPVKRLAFGAVLIQTTDSQESGYKILSGYLKTVQIDPVGSSDFMYQINRPRESTVIANDLRINRLSKWSVLRFRKLRIGVPVDCVSLQDVQLDKEEFGCRLELDINTKPDFKGDIPAEQLGPLFDELMRLGREISLNGDVPS
jgi:hypothetical protein